MSRYVVDFKDIDRTHVARVGGKAAHLAELSRIENVRVPPGFCVTTDAFKSVVAQAPTINEQLDQLSRLKTDQHEAIRALSAGIRSSVESIRVPEDVAAAIEQSLAQHGSDIAYAVRSSATLEDLPTTSFAGQHDTYLNVVGSSAVRQHVRQCWASLFNERAVVYRMRNGIDNRNVSIAAVVQQMVSPQAAGALFTADPVTGNRKVSAVEAVYGLGEALVSGLTNADAYKVRDGRIISNEIATKTVEVRTSRAGGTEPCAIDIERQRHPALTHAQVLRLVEIGRRIESHFGSPQDIEWCLVDDDFAIVQSRPITTLFPIPEPRDQENRVYVSVGHQQMMTDPMKPLGLSFWNLTTPQPMSVAAGRLFVDVTQALGSPISGPALLDVLGKSDPLIRDALQTILDRGDFIRPQPESGLSTSAAVAASASASTNIEFDPSIVNELIARSQDSVSVLKRDIQGLSGTALLDFIRTDIDQGKTVLFDPRSLRVIMAAINSASWLNEKMEAWLGEKKAADTLSLSVPNNITSEMGLALLDVADVIRLHPQVVAFLESVDDDSFLEQLAQLAGGREARDAVLGWLEKYGMRGVGEIDITRPRWSERPSMLLPLILGHVRNVEPGAGKRRFEEGQRRASQKEQELIARLRDQPDGEQNADETKRMIDRVRTFIGYREYPKYGKVSRSFIYKRALLEEAERLVVAGVLREKEDIFYLTLDELNDVVGGHRVDDVLIRERKDAFVSYHRLTPPRVLNSDGEALNGAYRRDDIPNSALVGLPVSSGVVEGRARIVLRMNDAGLEPGDVLVTTYTDPSWTPLFVSIGGLVTEVGGLMTHGAVIAREYGLPAVVGVERATQLIRDGQRIRVDGANGYVEILP